MSAICRADARVDASGDPRRGLSDARACVQDGSLDAAFALLDDVRAQGFALQLRLRNSLPVRWADNALVMQRSSVKQPAYDAKTRTRAATVSQQSRFPGNAPPVRRGYACLDDERARADPIADDLDWSHQRYRRRIEWDVAKRIARIDRELMSLPPDQRFWNKRRNREQQQQIAQQKELSRTKAREATLRERDSKHQHGSPAKKPVEKVSNVDSNALEVQSSSPTASYRSEMNAEKKAQPHHQKAVSPRGVSRPKPAEPSTHRTSQGRNKENLPPKLLRSQQQAPPGAVQSSRFPASDSKSAVDLLRSTNDQPPLSTTHEEKPTAAICEKHHLQGQEPPAATTESKINKLAHEIFLELDERDVREASVDDSVIQSHGERDHQRTKPGITVSGYQQHSSSVGKQVLSDFRNAPSMALYGPPAIAGDKHNRKLNSDVLRRLFSDLDSNRDGHLNRIETCMALHRLQIAVPAPKIASFFRRVHAESNKPDPKVRGDANRAALHQPLKEMINYKQFIAFVTAANDRQSVQRQQQGTSRQRVRGTPGSSEMRSTASPVAKRKVANSITPMQFSASISAPRERENALYELKSTDDEEDRLEKSVLKSIPDYLITRLLADERQGTRDSARSKTASVVRKSLEKLLSRDSVDEKMVQEIAQGLIREHLQNRDPLFQAKSEDEEEDLSGLRKAAAYFEKQSISHSEVEDELPAGEGRGCEDLDSWVNLLSEEQVSALVQEILNEKLPRPLRHDGVVDEPDTIPDEVLPISSLVPNPDAVKSHALEGNVETQGKSVDDKETDTQDFLSTHIRSVAEKEVQVSEDEAQSESTKLAAPEPDQKASQPSSEAVNPAPSCTRFSKIRTNLGKAVLLGSPANEFDETVTRKKAPATSLLILQKLRAERKRYQRVPDASASKSVEEVAERVQLGAKVSETTRPEKQVQTRQVDSWVDAENVEVSFDSGVGYSRWTHDEVVKVGQSTTSDSLPPSQLIEKKLCADGLSERSMFEVASRSSFSASSLSDLKSSADSQRSLFSDFAASARHSLQASTRRVRRNKWADGRGSVNSSGRRSSLGSEDLSEGEIERRSSLDLSDGEIFGKERDRVAMQKNASNRFFCEETATSDQLDSSDELNDTKSSIESGELLPITKLRSAYRERVLLDSSFSSAESGELEDGLLG